MKRLLPLFFLLAASASAQDVLADSAYRRLETEVQSVAQPLTRLVANAYIVLDEAMVTQWYQRADSIITLVTAHIVANRKAAATPIFWPGLAEHIALGLVLGEPTSFDLLSDDGAWWQARLESVATSPFLGHYGPQVVSLYGDYNDELDRRPTFEPRISLRGSFRSALSKEHGGVLVKLTSAGATVEQQALAPLVIAVFLEAQDFFYWQPRPAFSPEQDRLNEAADDFLLAYPESQYGEFVRRHVRKRYRPGPALGGAMAFGGGSPAGALGSRFEGGLGFEISLDWRDRNYHVGLTMHGAEQRVRDRFVVGEDVAERDENYQVLLIGLEGGPRVEFGRLDLQPYLAGGIVRIMPTKNSDGEIEHGSTWDPSTRLSYGYGLKTDLTLFSPRQYKWALRARLGRVAPGLGVRDGVDLSGPLSFFTIGISARMQAYTRVE